MPGVEEGGAFEDVCFLGGMEGNAFMIEGDVGGGIAVNNRQEVATAPNVVALSRGEVARRFAGLIVELLLLLLYPGELADGVGAGNF